jgi:hypothetical protein
MFDGSYKSIEDVKVGEMVLSYDLGDNKLTSKEVLSLEAPVRNHYYTIEFNDHSQVKATDEHPFYTKKGWASINPKATLRERDDLNIHQLEIGDHVKTTTGYKKIIGWLKTEGQVQTYNLEVVEDTHTFFAEDSLVHNKCYKEGSLIDGIKVENIEVGDYIYGKRVIKTYKKTMLEPIKAKIISNDLTVTYNHLIEFDGALVPASQTDYKDTLIYGTVYDFEVTK